MTIRDLHKGLLYLTSGFLLSCLISTSADAAHVLIYRWTDPITGELHFSDTPPDSPPVAVISLDSEPAAPDPEETKRIEAMNAETNRFLKEERSETLHRRQLAAEAARNALNCERARSWLTRLQSHPGSRLLIVENQQTARRMTEEERQRRIRETEAQIAGVCDQHLEQ